MNAITRTATPDDLDYLDKGDPHVSRDRMRQKIAERQVLLLAVDDARASWLRWGLFWDEIPIMNLLWVDRAYRGKGLGRLIVEAWEQQQRVAGHRMVMTSTQADEDAQHFYRHLGYVDAGALFLPGEAAELFFIKHLS